MRFSVQILRIMLLLRLPLDLTLCFSHSNKTSKSGIFQTLASWYTLSLKPKGKGDGKESLSILVQFRVVVFFVK